VVASVTGTPGSSERAAARTAAMKARASERVLATSHIGRETVWPLSS
jgi:hypothetical protein